MRNVHRDRITTSGRRGALVRVADTQKLYIVDGKSYKNWKKRGGDGKVIQV